MPVLCNALNNLLDAFYNHENHQVLLHKVAVHMSSLAAQLRQNGSIDCEDSVWDCQSALKNNAVSFNN